jgi:hypothetical protein
MTIFLRHNLFFFKSALIGLFLLAPALSSYGQEADTNTDALELARRVYARDDGHSSTAQGKMILQRKNASTEERSLTTYTKDYGNLSKRLVRFHSPKTIEGTGFLSWENMDRDDDQFLFLPALKRSRRIAGSQREKSFVNSDYTYEDLERRKPELDQHKIVGHEKVLGYDCVVLESTPRDPSSSQYGKRVSWVAKDMDIILRAAMYDKKGEIIKTFNANNVKLIDDYWTITDSKMSDLLGRHSTRLVIDVMQYNQGVDDEVFTQRYLERY